MFYYPNVLQRHTGCFATVWLAATKGTKIAKREYMKVNVINTCRRIMQYILQQVPAPYHGCPIPRLSLYLSAQLSYGVVCVFHRQCDLLIEEMKVTLDRLHKAEMQLKIDMLQPDQPLLLADNLMLMQMLENAPDPFFGIMEVPPEFLDPMGIPQIRTLLETSGPDIVRLEETPPKRRKRSTREESDHLASPEAITMREEEPVLLPPGEIGLDIPELSEVDLDFLTSDLPAFPDAEALPGPPKRVAPSDGKTMPKDKGLPKAKRKDGRTEPEDERDEGPKEKEGEEEIGAEIERKRRELEQLERDIEALREEQRLRELQMQSDREQERRDREDRESHLLEDVHKEMQALKKAQKELERLERTGAAEELLLEKERTIERLKELQKERESQWEAESIRQLQQEVERERERMQEGQRDKEKLREAEQIIEQLRRSLVEKEEMERTERISEASALDISRILEAPEEAALPGPLGLTSEPDLPVPPDELPALPVDGAPATPTLQLGSPLALSPQLMLPEMPLDRPIRRPGRKTKLIIDEETQIESTLLREQTNDPHICTITVPPVTLPSMRPRTAASLLDSPTYEHFMAPELIALWTHGAVLEPMQYIKEREEDIMSEVVRAVTESGVSIMLSSELSLEVSEEERSRPIVFTPLEGRSILEEKLLPIVSEVPELTMEMPETQDILEEDIQRNLYDQINSEGQAELLHLIPPSSSRLLVSRLFFSCLVLHTQEVITMAQAEPYGEILVTAGPRGEHVVSHKHCSA